VTKDGAFVDFMKRVGIVCGGIIGAATVIAFVSSYAWRTATRPIMQSITDERISRQMGDSLIVQRLELMGEDILVLGHALPTAWGSPARAQAKAYFDGRAQSEATR
jgi:hypothetical protein